MSATASLKFKKAFWQVWEMNVWSILSHCYLTAISPLLFINLQTLLQTSWCWGLGIFQQWFPCCCSWSPPIPSLWSSVGPPFYWGPVREPTRHHTPTELPETRLFLLGFCPRDVTSAAPETLGRSVEDWSHCEIDIAVKVFELVWRSTHQVGGTADGLRV